MFCVMEKRTVNGFAVYGCLSKHDTEKGACKEVEKLIVSGVAEKDLSIFEERPFRTVVAVMCSEHA